MAQQPNPKPTQASLAKAVKAEKARLVQQTAGSVAVPSKPVRPANEADPAALQVGHRYGWRLLPFSGSGYVQASGDLTAKVRGGSVRLTGAELAAKVAQGAQLFHFTADCAGCGTER